MESYFNIYKDIWSWHKKYSLVENSDEYWQQVLAEGELERKGKELRERECDRGG